MKSSLLVVLAAVTLPNPAPSPAPQPLQTTVPVVAVNPCNYAVDFYLITQDAREHQVITPWFTAPARQTSRPLLLGNTPLVHNPALPLQLHRRKSPEFPQAKRINNVVPDGVAPGPGQHPTEDVTFDPAEPVILVNLCGDYEPSHPG